MKKKKNKNKEQKFIETLNAVATIKKVFAALMIAHDLAEPEIMTVLTKLNHDVLVTITKGSKATLRDNYEILKNGMDILIKFEEASTKK